MPPLTSRVYLINVTRKNLCFLHILFFASQLLLSIILIFNLPYRQPGISVGNKDIKRYFWHLGILRYIRIYLTLKSLITANIYGYFVSVCLILHNDSLTILMHAMVTGLAKNRSSMILEIVFMLLCITELVVCISYLIINRADIVIQKFKKTCYSPRFMEFYKCKQIIDYLSVVDFLISGAHAVGNIFGITIYISLFTIIEFVLSSLSLIMIQIDFKFQEKTFKKYVLIAMWLDVIFSVVSFIFAVSYVRQPFNTCNFVLTACDFLFKLLVDLVLFYHMYRYKKLAVSLEWQKHIMKRKPIYL
ncbi:uncharacterized protein VICG_01341 [Vittaforma corneae ATCC 50505]|uniref:Uncharacterized protein n=1 Tax=Vittaforma corneae (strain ATCC 50505) TaxID=993615 RepID=L2GL56_VITCO|nr:uncharacterized protein VICG_01341 [Vittaforma corneae ATCC 50505]ELA41593.1 hypothetical protein VICG_01341 [Vittaforma corneae ATCC 50505]